MFNKIVMAVLFAAAFALCGACASGSRVGADSSVGSVNVSETVAPKAAAKEVKGVITSFEKYGHAVLNIPIQDLLSNGFELGDGVTVEFSNGYRLKDIPFYNGYYVKKGEPLLRAYPGHKFAAVCINYGKINEIGGLKEGNACTIRLTSKGRYFREQALNSLSYSDNRSDYESDEVFANFRNVKVGDIGAGKLYRSASPIDNSHSRALYADQLVQGARISLVLNLADSRNDINRYTEKDDFKSSYYIRLFDSGRVLPLSLAVDFSSSDFKTKLVDGLRKLADMNASGPILVHCTEGKDRAGFVSALLEALMGASYEEIVGDYMLSYKNYYSITKEKDSQKYAVIVSNNIDEMLKVIAGVSDAKNLSREGLRNGAMRYLKSGGATEEQIRKIVSMLT
ncbi:MAG TPA: hypothetical protein DCO86_04840 [Spirochaetaceae bacterium]|nr:hypothetical protein [Spirochaetaceae bacterium]